MRSQQRVLCLGLFLMLFASHSLASGKEKAEEQGRPLLKAAADHSLLGPGTTSPVKVSLTFAIHAAKQMQGTYSWTLASTGDWRKEMTLSDYADLQIGRNSTVWEQRTLDFDPLQAMWAKAVFENFQYLNNPDDVIEKYFTTADHHVDLRCLDMSRDKKAQTLCFDQHGNLVRADINELNMTFEYSDYGQVGQKFLAHQVIGKREGRVILEGTIDAVETNAQSDPKIFEPPAGSTRRPGCFTPTLPKIAKKVFPQYPDAARNSRQQGTVIIFATIASDGSVRNPQVIQTIGKDLDEASLTAVRAWHYEPAKCGAAPTDFDTAISVKYSIQAR